MADSYMSHGRPASARMPARSGVGPRARPASAAARSRPRGTGLVAPAPVIVAGATGAGLFVLFTISDGAGLLPVGSVIAYWILFAATYLVLGTPGRDWRLPVGRADLVRLACWAGRAAAEFGRRSATVTVRAIREAARRVSLHVPNPSRQT